MESCLYQLQKTLPYCTPSERKAADYILKNPRKAIYYGITEIASKSGSSSAAITRLCKRLNAGGFKDLKALLARDIYKDDIPAENPSFQLTSDTPVADILASTLDASRRDLEVIDKTLNRKNLETTVARLHAARSVQIFGIGASALVASDLYQKLSRIGYLCLWNPDSHVQIASACNMGGEDVAFAISYSGETDLVNEAARQAKLAGAYVISLTRLGSNTLSRLSHLVISIPNTEALFRQGAGQSRINQLIVIDVLYAALLSRDLDRSLERIERTRIALPKHAKRRNP